MIETMEFDDEVTITLDGENYPMLMTTYATSQIVKKFGGLDNLNEKIMGSNNEGTMVDNACWLAALLINQPIMRYNRKHRDAEKPLFEADDIAIMTSPREAEMIMGKVSEAISRGSERVVPDGVPAGKN